MKSRDHSSSPIKQSNRMEITFRQTAGQTQGLAESFPFRWEISDLGRGGRMEGRREAFGMWCDSDHPENAKGRAGWGAAGLLNQNWRRRSCGANWKDEMCAWLESIATHTALCLAAKNKGLSETTRSHVGQGRAVTAGLQSRICKNVLKTFSLCLNQ